jgi:hypothetical protein
MDYASLLDPINEFRQESQEITLSIYATCRRGCFVGKYCGAFCMMKGFRVGSYLSPDYHVAIPMSGSPHFPRFSSISDCGGKGWARCSRGWQSACKCRRNVVKAGRTYPRAKKLMQVIPQKKHHMQYMDRSGPMFCISQIRLLYSPFLRMSVSGICSRPTQGASWEKRYGFGGR